jgi:N-methylhydantoinase B
MTASATTQASHAGWEGRTLRAMLEENERRFEETGCYAGVERLELKESDPIRYERLYSQLRGGVVSARETAKRIAASPLVAEMGELCFALYTPEGDAITISTGIIVHVQTMGHAIKYMIRNDYESDPGIKDRDIYVNNDPQISNVHCADVQTMVPIFWEGELISWAAAVTHECDVGARTPGSSAVGPINRFEDGIDLPAMRCGENDRLFRDYVGRCMKAVRTPLYWMLDEKTRMAGCHLIRRLVTDLVEREGVDVYKQFIRETIEDGRLAFRERVREQLVPGTYRTPVFTDYQFAAESSLPEECAVDAVMHIPIEVEVEPEGRLRVSLEGANAWGYNSFNCSPIAIRGGLWALLTQMLMSTDKVNDGASHAVEINLPLGSWSNPGHHMTSHSNAWFTLVPFCNANAAVLSRGYQARGYVEEVMCGWGEGNYFQGGSLSDVGDKTAIGNMEVSCLGGGASVIRDGLDYASSSWFPTGDMGDVEDWEIAEPLLYVGRSVKRDSAGLGRRRGGLGFESLRMVWGQASNLQYIGAGNVFTQSGVFGGYPMMAGYRHIVRNNNLRELFEQRLPYPVTGGDPLESEITALVEGDVTLDKRGVTLPEPCRPYDLLVSAVKGGPGLGDPLERAPADIEADLNSAAVSPRLAANICGAVVGERADGSYAVDVAATAERRDAMRRDRAERSVPVRDWIAREREERVLPRRVIAPVAEMYRSSMSLSEEWSRRYREFWNLDEDFTY